MSSFSIGLSGLTASQRLIDLTGHNITNAGTPGYHRQLALLAARTVGLPIGTGVEITKIVQARNGIVESALLRNQSESLGLSAQLSALQQIQTALSPQEGSVHDLLEQFFNQVEQLAGNPGDMTQRRVVLSTASNLADRLDALRDQLGQIAHDTQAESQAAVDEINQLTPQIATLNASIQQNEVRGIEANDLRDHRSALISRLAELIDTRAIEQDHGQVTVITAGLPVVTGNQSTRLQLTNDAQDQAAVVAEGTTLPLRVESGKIAGLLQLRNDVLPGLRNQIATFTRELVGRLDGLQATGLGLSGPAGFLSGDRAVRSVTAPLDQAGLSFPPRAGDLYVSVTETATGQRVLTRVPIDPSTQSLQDVAAALSAVGNIQAIADPQTKTLKLLAAPGYSFDFAGQLPTAPDTVAMTGTTTPTVGGTYTGKSNDTYTFQVTGNGTVGVTAGLALEVRDGGGTLLGSFNIGQGYEPGSTLNTVNGVSVRLASGTANAGDQFTVPVVADPDTAGILPALGLNTFFVGSADDFHVRPELLAHPELLAAGRTGQTGDGSNLKRMAALRDQKLLGGGTQGFREFYASMVGEVGSSVQDLQSRQSAADAIGQGLQAEQQSLSGVDPNEELVRLLQYQRSFQASARFITVVNDTLTDLLNII